MFGVNPQALWSSNNLSRGSWIALFASLLNFRVLPAIPFYRLRMERQDARLLSAAFLIVVPGDADAGARNHSDAPRGQVRGL
jgi:hypothetical protein